jgi:hypothetical protein
MEDDAAHETDERTPAISDVQRVVPISDQAKEEGDVHEGASDHEGLTAMMEHQQGMQCLMHSVNNILHAFASSKVSRRGASS